MELELIEATEILPVVTTMNIDSQAEADIEEVRQTYKDLLSKGKEGLDVAFTVVEGSEHPRAIEVFAGLIKNLSDVNGKLIDLHKARKELSEPVSDRVTNNTITQNNVFNGSPADLLDLLDEDYEDLDE